MALAIFLFMLFRVKYLFNSVVSIQIFSFVHYTLIGTIIQANEDFYLFIYLFF